MKILVCNNSLCKNNKSTELLVEIKAKCENTEVEVEKSECMDLCEYGPNIMVFPEMKLYKNVSIDRIDDILSNHIDDLQHNDNLVYDSEVVNQYLIDPMHRRTVKLFRYHLEKYQDMSVASLREIIKVFKEKYDVKGLKFTYPVKVSLFGSTKGPDLPKVVNFLGKQMTISLMDKYLKKAQ